jgi:Undecaprenyl-phosphate galactose phosphotransferase WbaP
MTPRVLLNVLLLAGGDILALSLAVWLVFEARGLLSMDVTIPSVATVIYPVWVATAWLEGLFPGWGLSPVSYVRRMFRSIAITFLLTTATFVFFGAGAGWSRATLLLSGLTALFLIPLVRWGLRRALMSVGLWGLPVAVLGSGRAARLVIDGLRRTSEHGLSPVAVYDDDLAPGDEVMGVRVAGPLAAVGGSGVRAAVVAMPSLGRERLDELLRGPLAPVERVFLVPDLLGLESVWVEAMDVNGVLTLEVQRHLLRRSAQVAKRVLDLCLTVAGGVVASPVFLALMLAVRLDSPGPVFFRQARIGLGGREFRVWKFRTMRADAESVLASYLASRPELREEWARDHKLRDDPRVTRMGRWLRRTSLDELPQVLNVLAGEMSLVGPRPIVREEVVKYARDFDLYARVRPGLTGIWQVSGRNDTGYEQRVALDVYYIRNWSVWLDVLVLLRTVKPVLFGKGAY